MTTENFVFLDSYDSDLEAKIVSSCLAGSGIKFQIRDHNTIANHPPLAGVMGGIKIYVPKSKLHDAQQLLKDIREKHPQDLKPISTTNKILYIFRPFLLIFIPAIILLFSICLFSLL